MSQHTVRPWLRIISALAGLFILAALGVTAPAIRDAKAQPANPDDGAGKWVVLAWNDLGMHCYNADFQDLAVLPPYNTLWAQVIEVGDPPKIITGTVTVEYRFADNTDSVSKSNFWDYDKQLFGVDLAPNVGLTGAGLDGLMEESNDHFIVEGIPLTEFTDSAPTTAEPYQLATIVVKDAISGTELATTVTVAPVSTEMHCDYCHYDGGVEDIATGRVETNILTLHDHENQEEYPPGHDTPLMQRRPVLCAECHASNALGAPGLPGIPNLSKAMHSKHADADDGGDDDELAAAVSTALPDNFCYNCHPGPQTQCMRDVMSARGMTCTDCHGSMEEVASNPNPWLNEPRCSDCHTDPEYSQDQPLYRMSTGHGGVRCEGCHDSTHAIAPSTQPKDAIKFIGWQGHQGTLDTCTVCHLTPPAGEGPHGLLSPWGQANRAFMPSLKK
ncbi:MAG: cytochrome c3 family protein [Anaerolineales bacterium]|nr:cytochrome c3 family protein [Anaerolineales bacterium]